MVNFFLQFHSGWRFLVLLGTVLVAAFFLYALATRRTSPTAEKRALMIWSGLVDSQVLLGILLLLSQLIDGRDIPGKVIGHITMGVVAMLVVHVPAFYKRLNGEPNTQVRRIMGLALPIIVIIVVSVGILSIRDGIFAMTDV